MYCEFVYVNNAMSHYTLNHLGVCMRMIQRIHLTTKFIYKINMLG